MKTFEKIVPYLKRSIKPIVIGVIVLILVDAIQLYIPRIMQQAIDRIGEDGFTRANLFRYSLVIIILSGMIAILRYWWRILIIGNSWKIEKGIRQEFYDHLLTLSKKFFDRAKIGDLMAHSTNDINAVRMLFGIGFVAAADIIILTIASIFFMISINLRLTMLAIIPLPILSIAIAFFGRKMHKQFAKVQGSFSDLSGMIQESISGVRVIKAFVQERAELKKMAGFSKKYVNDNIKMAKLSGFFHPFNGFIISISMMIVLIFGGRATIRGEITIGEFIAFYAYLGMLIWPMIAIGWIVELYQRGTASLKRLNKIFTEIPDVNDDKADSSIRGFKNNIEVKNLNFTYSGTTETVLENLCFNIQEGMTLAIVGKTGCGKTTVIDLLTRVYNPPPNTIFYDSIEIYKIPLTVLRKKIITVPQDIFLFSDTIRNNVKLGCQDAQDCDIVQSLKIAHIYEELMEFDKGLETIVGERGVTLSGGQKQRLAIARALLTDPGILIFDDSLSAVDTKTEKSILNHLIEARKGKTTIIIAHRISSLKHAEKIIVIDNKKIIESGTHDELLKNENLYSDLYYKQQIQEKLETEVIE